MVTLSVTNNQISLTVAQQNPISLTVGGNPITLSIDSIGTAISVGSLGDLVSIDTPIYTRALTINGSIYHVLTTD